MTGAWPLVSVVVPARNEKLIETVINLVNDKQRREELSRNIAPLGIRDADEVIADTVLKSVRTV